MGKLDRQSFIERFNAAVATKPRMMIRHEIIVRDDSDVTLSAKPQSRGW